MHIPELLSSQISSQAAADTAALGPGRASQVALDTGSANQVAPATGTSNDILPASHPARGKHLLLTLEGCSSTTLNDRERIREITLAAATATGATVLQMVSHQFQPQGVTTLALLAESHASLHTYPEFGTAFWDCFTCGDECDPLASIDILRHALQASAVKSNMVLRD